jgi:hypothetical protein
MLFLFAMEVLNSLIRRADEWNLFQRLDTNPVPHRVSIYANDLIMFIAPSGRDLSMTKTIFDIFEGTSGLGCNLAGSILAELGCWCRAQLVDKSHLLGE